MSGQPARQPKGTRLCRVGSWAAAAGLLLIAVSSGHKLGFLPSWQIAFLALGLGGIAMAVALVTAGIGLLRSGGTAGGASATATWLAFFSAVLFTGNSLVQMRGSFSAPPIHDISTDTVNPPPFVAVMPLRAAAGATNPPDYAGTQTAALQAQAYPDLATLVLPDPMEETFRRAEAAARALGWEIVAAVPEEGRIEAIATTAWIGFKDDVVIRIAANGPGTRVDIRSKSRVGRGDAGMNARRIRAFRDLLSRS